MAGTRISRRRTTVEAAPEPGAVVQWFKELVGAKAQQRLFKSRQEELTKRLKALVEGDGVKDADGHIWYDLPEVVEVDGKKHSQLQMQRKVSAPLREERAEEILKAKGLWDSCTTTVTVIDQEALMAAHYDGKISEAELDSMFPKVVQYALMTPVAK